jgi:hypothetical protein
MIRLGRSVRCRVTGFEGIAVSRLVFLNGCEQYGVKPRPGADAKYPETIYLDVEQLEDIGPGVEVARRPGGGAEHTVRAAR